MHPLQSQHTQVHSLIQAVIGVTENKAPLATLVDALSKLDAFAELKQERLFSIAKKWSIKLSRIYIMMPPDATRACDIVLALAA